MARASTCTIVYTLGQSFLYPMVLTAYLYAFSLSSNRLGIRALLSDFLSFSNFPFLMLNQWVGTTVTFARASGTSSVAEGPKSDTMIGPLQGSLVPNFMLLAQTVLEILADF